ncbi:MAG: Nre family DNA repair protein [Candidatus Verstraetearchaeota archaeon]|nr:Nre family DNA repair protein [Candidatus Verstraetearchaeota archaeon]
MYGWFRDLLPAEVIEAPISSGITVKPRQAPLCTLCRGGKRLCGRSICPIELKARALVKNSEAVMKTELSGSSPPAVFVGRYGYPKVSVGPMVPPLSGDTSVMDIPEAWLSESIESIVNYRYSLVRGTIRVEIDSAKKGGRMVDLLQELSMGISPAEAEVRFTRPPAGRISIDDNSQPFGPSAPLERFDLSSVKVDHRIERAFYDGDLKAADAAYSLYSSGVQVSKLQRAFSMGVFGIQKNRRIVPTRWSITAVDSMLSQRIIDEVKNYETIDKYCVYFWKHQHNTFAALLFPRAWSFEWMEAWFPGTFWNQGGSAAAVIGDYEGFSGRKTYPEIGGCYFSCRLGVAEHLRSERRQATALVVREIMPEFPLPLGVWFVRENIRTMFRQRPLEFEDLAAALRHLSTRLRVPLRRWVSKSTILRDAIFQRRIDEYFKLGEIQCQATRPQSAGA